MSNHSNHPGRHNRPLSDHVHPSVYAVVAGLVAWFVLGGWIFFGGAAYMGLALTVISGFFLMVALIPLLLWLVWLRHGTGPSHRESFREWFSGDLDTAQGRRPAAGAAIEIALPLAAAAVGMTLIGIIFHFVSIGATQI
jgi:hypothetical protein